MFHDNPLGINTSPGTLHDSYIVLYTLGDTCTTNLGTVVDRPNKDYIVHLGGEITEPTKKFMRKNNLMHLPGHELIFKKDTCLLHCFLAKNNFSRTFFYDCPILEAISIPENAKVNEQILVQNDPIRYYQFNKKGIKLKLE